MLDDNRSTKGDVVPLTSLSIAHSLACSSFVSFANNRAYTEIGIFLTAVGLGFTLLGVILLFDRGFLALGNVRSFFAIPYLFSHGHSPV